MLLFQINGCNSGFLKKSLIYTFKIKCFIVKYWEYKNIIFKNSSKFYFLLECQTNYLTIICNINEQEMTLPDLKEIKYVLQLLTSMQCKHLRRLYFELLFEEKEIKIMIITNNIVVVCYYVSHGLGTIYSCY